MERLTERTAVGILVKENYEKETLKTLYSCYGGKPNPHYTNCEEGYEDAADWDAYRAIGTPEECQKSVAVCKAMIDRKITPENMEEYMKFEDECVKCGFTLKSLLEAREKQIPYKLSRKKLVWGVGKCKCGVEFLDRQTGFCGNCGQKLDWEGER